MYAWLFIFGIYLQATYGMSTLKAGIVCSAFSIAFGLSSRLLGRVINKLGNKILIQLGFILSIFAFLWMASITLRTGLWQLIIMFFLLGVAITNINAPSMTAATQAVSSEKAGIASGTIFTIRWLGGSIGIAITTIIFQYFSHHNFINFLKTSNIFSLAQKNLLSEIKLDAKTEAINVPINVIAYHSLIINQIKIALTAGLMASCLALARMSAIGLICASTLTSHHKVSG